MNNRRLVILIYDVGAAAAVIGLLLLLNSSTLFENVDQSYQMLILFAALLLAGLMLKIRNKRKLAIRKDDELSRQKKFKAGYYAYYGTLYIWMFIFILSPKFHNTQLMLLGGFILSALTGIISKIISFNQPDDNQN